MNRFHNLKLLKSILKENYNKIHPKPSGKYECDVETISTPKHHILPGLYMDNKTDNRIKDAVKH